METVREVENFFGREFSAEELADLVEDLNFYTDEIKRLYELEDDTNAERTFALGTLAGNAIAGRIRERWGAKISDEQKDEIYKIGIEVARGKYPSLEILEPELDRMLAGERENSNNAENEMKKERMVFEEEEFKEMQNRRQKSVAANFVLEKLAAANIEVITDKGAMREILESGKLVQKMAAFHGTGGTEKSFNGYGTYVVSVNEGDAKQIGMKVASKKYGDAFYVKGQAFETFLKEHKFSPYWAELLKQSRLDNVEELQSTMMLSDAKGNAELERQKNELSTLFKYGLVEHKREKAFVYSIDIPDNNGKNYLPYENPVGLENAEKINGALEKLGTQWRVTRNDGGRQIYFNTLSEKVFGGSQEEASKFLRDAGLVGMRMNDKNYIVFDEKDINVNKRVQFMTDKNGEIYGFAHEGKIYLDPDLMNANTPAHEYTHLWDAYTRQTNPELWERGKDIFRQTRLWNEVKGDPNYADIADDDDLLLSEVHARICGDIAQKVLERMAEQDGEIARDRAIDWDKEVAEYVASELGAEIATPELGSENYVSDSIRHEIARNFLAQPMKDLLAGKEITLEREQEKSELYKENEAELKFIVEEMLEENLPELQKMAKPAENKKDPMQTQQGLSDVQGTPSATSTHIRHQNNIVEIKSQEHFAGKFGALANEIGNSASPMQPGEFLDRIKNTFDMDVATETTGYVFSREDGTSFKLRVANHKAVLKNRTGDKTEMTSVVIQLYDKRGQDNNKARLSEFVYFPESLDKETQLGIVSGIKDWISSHEYTDRNYDQMYVSTARALRERLKESERSVQKMARSKERKETESALSEEDLEYIRSPEFIEKFGDWEKAKRLEKLKAAEAIVADGKIIVEGEEISENLDYLREDKNKKLLQILARNLGRQVVGIYHNDDLDIDVKVSMNNIDEIKHHNILFENHIEAIKNIPEIIQKAIYIGNESNSDKTRHPNITEYKYFAIGLKIDGVDYTCKSVIGVDRNGNNYYDQSLSTIEKGRFVDIVMQKNKPGNLSPLISPWESEFEKDSNPSAYYDKRLINICQVPQMKYLDKNLMPTKEAVKAVRAGKLHIEKNGQGETMVDETRNAGTERIQKMATPAENANDIVPSARGLSEERETAERLRRAAATDYDDPIEAKEAWHNGTEEEREAIYRAHAARPRNAPSADDFVRITAESADAGLFADMRDEMGNDPLAGNTPETLSVLRNIERLAVEARNGAETGRLAKEFVASLEESGIRLYKSGRKNLLRMLDIRNLAAENRDIPETVPIGEAGSFFWNGHNIRTDGEKSSYDLIAEAHSTAYRRLHAKEEMRKILAENENDHELTEEETARLSGAEFRSIESLGDIGKLAAEIGKEELFRKIGSTAFRREEAVEKFAEENAGEHETPDHDPTDGLPHDFVPPEDKPDYIDENGEPRWLSDDEANGLKEEFSEPKKQVEFYVPESVAKVFREHPAVRAAYGQDMSEHSAEAYAGEICSILKEFSKVNPGEWNLSADEKIAVAGISREITEIGKISREESVAEIMAYFTSEPYRNGKEDLGEVFSKIISTKNENGYGFAFSTGDIAQKIREGDFSQTKAETVEIMGKIESTAGNEFSGGNEKVTQSTESEKPKPQGMTVKVRDENGKAAEIRIDFGKTKVPQFAMVTQNGLKTFSEMTVAGHDAEANSWTLSNKEGEKIIVPDKTIKELVSEKQAEHAQGFDENTPAYNKMLEAQYDDFFKQRENTANNFRHNLSVYCRKEANSPLDALKVAKAIIQDMPAEERRKTKGLLNSLRRDGESVNEVIVRTYLDAVKETPLNEEHLKHGRYDKIVARPMYDMVSANGAKIDENFDLKIGDTVGGVAFKTGKTFGIGKDKIFHDCKIISSSKENNMVTLMDGDKSFYDIPRDTFLKSYAKQQRQEKKQSHKNSMRLDIER